MADLVRAERARLGLYERLAGARGAQLVLRTAGGGMLGGVVVDLGDGWVRLEGRRGGQALVRVACVRAVEGLEQRPALTASAARRFGLGVALRAVARDRAAVRVVDVDGTTREGHLVGVGADVLDLREHPVDVPGRRRESGRVVLVPYEALAAVLSSSW